jgi:flagellar motor switch protein FliM
MGEPAKISRELTDIELSVMEGIIVRILGNLREAWSNVIDLRPRLGNIETNPQFAQIVPPNDMVVLITLETKVGEVEGVNNLCIPYISIEPVMPKLSARSLFSDLGEKNPVKDAGMLKNAVYQRYTHFEHAFPSMNKEGLQKLKKGSRIPLSVKEMKTRSSYRYKGIKGDINV